MAGSVVAAPTDIENQCDDLVTSIKKEWAEAKLSLPSPFRCIYRVPDRLRRERKVDYEPRVISIGPLHHGNIHLQAMEDHKKRYLERFMSRYNLELKDYIRKMKDQEENLRGRYAESVKPEDSNEFVKIILVDAIFVIEFLLAYSNLVPQQDDCIFGKPNMMNDVILDLVMLENQLPFFILKDIFDPHIFKTFFVYFSSPDHFVEWLSVRFLSEAVAVVGDEVFGRMLPNDLEEKIYSSEEEVQHFVDLLRRLWMAPLSNIPSETLFVTKKVKSARLLKQTTAPRIEKLHLAGVKFQKVESPTTLFDIRFDEGILTIPKLKIGDSTGLVLRNLIAFEQCSSSEDYCISDYVSIMDELVDTSEDVKLLVKNTIIENDLGGGDHALSSLINSLSTGLIYDSNNFYYGDLCGKLDKFHRSKWRKRMAVLKRNYFNTPWSIISFVAAVLLLIFTAIQTICSVISVLS